MNILSIDTSNNLASVAIMKDTELLSYNVTEKSSQQAEKLFQLISLSLAQAKLNLADITLMSVTNGPGSFTGVRIGLAAMMGLQAAKKKSIALSNFQVLAHNANANSKIAVILDARRDQVYYQLFNKDLTELSTARLIAIEDLSLPADFLLVGDGVKFFSPSQQAHLANVDARMLAHASEYFYNLAKYSELKPLYIREPDISLPKLQIL